MKRERKATIVTVAILAVAFGVVVGRKTGWQWRPVPKPPPGPQDAIYSMLDAARAGDVNAYMAWYDGQMAASLRQSLAETGRPGFTRYLQDTNASIKGVALSEPQPISEREVKVRVEYVYQDRNEAQFMYLEKSPAGWKITRIDTAERVKTLIPYGTPVQ